MLLGFSHLLVFYSSNNVKFCTIWINLLKKPQSLQYLKRIQCTQTPCFCSSATCCFAYQSKSKDPHAGIIMSSCVRKGKWYKFCVKLFTNFLFQNFNADVANDYCPQKEDHHTFWQRPKTLNILKLFILNGS